MKLHISGSTSSNEIVLMVEGQPITNLLILWLMFLFFPAYTQVTFMMGDIC